MSQQQIKVFNLGDHPDIKKLLSQDNKIFEELSNMDIHDLKTLLNRLSQELVDATDFVYKTRFYKKIDGEGKIVSVVKFLPEIEDVRGTLHLLAELIKSGEIDDWSYDDLIDLVNNVVRGSKTRRIFVEVSKGLTDSQKEELKNLALKNNLLVPTVDYNGMILKPSDEFSGLGELFSETFRNRLTIIREDNFPS
jgi:hypothetical protein